MKPALCGLLIMGGLCLIAVGLNLSFQGNPGLGSTVALLIGLPLLLTGFILFDRFRGSGG